MSCCRLSVVVSWRVTSGHPRPSLFGHRCTVGVLAGRATESRVTLWQSANPCCVFVGVVTSCVPCARVHGRAPRSCATENTYTPDRLEALSKLSVVAIPSPSCHFDQIFCGLWVLPPTRHLVEDLVDISCSSQAVSQSVLFTQVQICFLFNRLIHLNITAIVATWDTLYFVSAVL